VLVTGHIPVTSGERHLDVLGYLLVATAGVSLVLCRRRPDVVVGIVTAVLGVYLLRDYVRGPVFGTGWIGLFFLSWRSTWRAAVVGAAALCTVLVAASAAESGYSQPANLAFVGWSATALALGAALRNRRSYLTELEEHARYLERTREEEARRRVAEDRLRIARDLHDSVAHAMATINVQAGAAAHVVDRRPAAAKEALTAIQRSSADVLDELAAMLRLLRTDGEEEQAAARVPTPRVGQIAEMVASMREARLPVSLAERGALDTVPTSIGTAAYRIVQESLTNVIRHAASAPTAVTVRFEDHLFTVEVTDDGPGSEGGPGREGGAGGEGKSGTGMGLRGMRERAVATGGVFEAGPRPGGGFSVRASWVVPS
jgi:signal transduction histidine kinase